MTIGRDLISRSLEAEHDVFEGRAALAGIPTMFPKMDDLGVLQGQKGKTIN